MEFFSHISTFLHSVGSSSEGSQGWIPSLIGAATSIAGVSAKGAVMSQVHQNEQNDQNVGDKRLEDRANHLP